jgi:hypothetical protein
MNKYKLLVKLYNGMTTTTYVWAESDYAARILGETQYGKGNILNCIKV